MSRIADCFQALKQQHRKALIPYIVSGDPHPSVTVEAMHALVNAGADVIELGVPFSDPMAEGPVIQLAHERALAHKVSLTDVLNVVETFRKNDATTPIVLMGYANPVEAMGYASFVERAKTAGVDGVLIVDMPPEEAGEFKQLLSAADMDLIFLIAPTTSDSRIQQIASLASGYLYYVSLKGVTGAGHLDVQQVIDKTKLIETMTDLPVCVGFGIKNAESAQQIAAVSDGVVIGSALIGQIIETGVNESDKPAILNSINAFIKSIRDAI